MTPVRKPKQATLWEKTSFLIPSPEKQKKDKVLRTGVVQRYRPAFSREAIFISRHLELTNQMLKYYGKTLGNHANQEPLFRIPVNQISQACLVTLPKQKSFDK